MYATHKWRGLGHYLLLGGGAAFLLSGLFFFFAYNWAALHRFAKLGTVGGLLLLCGLFGVFAPLGERPRQVALTATVVLIGLFFAVAGQVYQTGANAFDFFLAWTLLSLPWVAAVRFAPLWGVLVALLNTCFVTYSQQYGIELSFFATSLLLFSLNVLCWVGVYALAGRRTSFDWLLAVVALWAVVIAVANLGPGVAESELAALVMLGVVAGTLTGWAWFGLRRRRLYYVALAGGGGLLAGCFYVLRYVGIGTTSIFLVALAVLGGVSWLTRQLGRLNADWYGRR